MSDFSLIDAIEAGIVKVPRVPVADDAMTGDGPTFRDLWPHIRDDLPKKGARPAERHRPAPNCRSSWRGASQPLRQLREVVRAVAGDARPSTAGTTPPVFIVVCNNTNVSKLVFDWIAGWEQTDRPDGDDGRRAGQLPLFSQRRERRRLARIGRTRILVDSAQLESGEAMTRRLQEGWPPSRSSEFKAEYRARFPGRDADEPDRRGSAARGDEHRRQARPLGEHVRCVVSVSMLTEGWDANTVTHVLGVRAFGTQLLCEQVVGRGLRRRSYASTTTAVFEPEYAEVYGVPFSFIPARGQRRARAAAEVHRVRALEERADLRDHVPARDRLPTTRSKTSASTATFTDASRMTLSTKDVPTKTEHAPDRRRDRRSTRSTSSTTASTTGGRVRARQADPRDR